MASFMTLVARQASLEIEIDKDNEPSVVIRPDVHPASTQFYYQSGQVLAECSDDLARPCGPAGSITQPSISDERLRDANSQPRARLSSTKFVDWE